MVTTASSTARALHFPKLSLRIWAIIVGVLLVLGLTVMWRGHSDSAVAYRTVAVKRGPLTVAVSATGIVQPEEVIDVGAQVAGLIVGFGTDQDGKAIDYGSVVEEGTVLARIDDSLYRSDAAQATAQLARAKADLKQFQAKLLQAERDWKRVEKLQSNSAVSASEIESFRAAYEVALANISVGQAEIDQATAALQRAQRNVDYCIIKSPVKGVIIDKRVNIGQTVVSSLNAPSLFLLAKDLRRMQLLAAVNEADIGNVHAGQTVRFTVDAFPNDAFEGKVVKVRLNASMTQNVVTYTVEVGADNSSGRLLPYLTANALFEVSKKDNALLVPNGALRWSPAVVGRGSGMSASGNQSSSRVYVLRGDVPEPVSVQTGISDGVQTELLGGNIAEGAEVIVGVQDATPSGGGQQSSNPFAPQMFRGGKR